MPFALTKIDLEANERVLIVDDSPTVRRLFSRSLSPTFLCTEAGTFDEAISILRNGEFAVVITDIIMPGLSGIELLRKILDDFPHTEVVVASGIDRPQRALDAIRLGAFDYLIKPCEPEVLRLTVERAVARRKFLLDADTNKRDLETRNAELIKRKEQLERLQAQIIQSEKMASLGQLAAGVAHELNNPVGFVHANLQILDQYIHNLVRLLSFYDEAGSAPELLAGAEIIKQEIGYPEILDDIRSIVLDCRDGSDRIRDIAKNLRTFSQLDEAEYKETDIHEGIDSTVRMLSQFFSSGTITLQREYGILPMIESFPGQLNQVWMNLLANAAQSLGSGKGEVKIVTSADDENVYVEISDTGCGIPSQLLSRIFEPFFTTKQVGEGTGLGLAISFGIVDRHGGTITVNSRLNEGTVFKVQLPRHFEPMIDADEKSIVSYDALDANQLETRNFDYEVQTTYC